jgi:hypothetical protein
MYATDGAVPVGDSLIDRFGQVTGVISIAAKRRSDPVRAAGALALTVTLRAGFESSPPATFSVTLSTKSRIPTPVAALRRCSSARRKKSRGLDRYTQVGPQAS